MQNDVVANWLSSVAYSHSQSKATEEQYKRVWERFSGFTGVTASQILAEYERSDDRTFKRKYAQAIRFWIADLTKAGLTTTSIKVMVGAIKSFFKYNDLPLGMVPQGKEGIVYHNRDITKEEIVQIMALMKPREKAFCAIMAQSGLRPHTLVQLRLKHLEPLDCVPCKLEVPKEIAKGKYGSYSTFIGREALRYLQQYFSTRGALSPESLLFCAHDNPDQPISEKDMSRAFRLSARKLGESGALKYDMRKGKPSELRLYNLRKFFRKYAVPMGFEVVEYMMGHTIKGVDGNYRPKDPEFYRNLYAEKAMPFLRLESNTPSETEKTIEELKSQLAERDKEIEELQTSVSKIQKLTDFLYELSPEQIADFVQFRRQRKEPLEPFERAGKIVLVKKSSGTALRIVFDDSSQPPIEILNTPELRQKLEEIGKS